MTTLKAILLAGAALLGAIVAARAADNEPHVLLISVDGMHEIDLRLWVHNHPNGALAALTRRGTTFSNAYTTAPSDSFPGMIAQVTGATPKFAGVYYDEGYDRTFFAPAAKNPGCTGTQGAEAGYAENLDKSLATYTAGGTLGQPLTQIDPKNLPQTVVDGVCTPVLPHQFLRVNTIFEVLRSHGQHTAWSDKHPAYEILNGPSGAGVEDLYTPEINAQATDKSFTNILPAGKDFTTGFAAVRAHDGLKLDAVLSQIDGFDSTHTTNKGYTPAIYGMNFQALSVAQKLLTSADPNEASLVGGYLDAAATPGNALTQEFEFIDDSIGKMVAKLQTAGQYENTTIIISAKHGQSPIDPKQLEKIRNGYGKVLANDGYSFDTADDVALIWLDPNKRTKPNYQSALDDLRANQAALGIDHIMTSDDLAKDYQDPFKDPRSPDFLVVAKHGVVYTGSKTKIAEHGGLAEDDRHVGLLVSAAGLSGNTVDQRVSTAQIAPTILSTFHISPTELQGVQQEGTRALPGLGQ